MYYFHGSHLRGLKELTYTEENSRFGGDEKLIYGAAIYLTESEKEAKSYATGGSYYKVEINRRIFDTTDDYDMKDFVKKFQNEIGLDYDLLENELILNTIKGIIAGSISGVSFHTHLFEAFSNDQDLYNLVICDKFESDCNLCLEKLESMFNCKFIKVNRKGVNWVICLDFSGDGIKIVKEINVGSE